MFLWNKTRFLLVCLPACWPVAVIIYQKIKIGGMNFGSICAIIIIYMSCRQISSEFVHRKRIGPCCFYPVKWWFKISVMQNRSHTGLPIFRFQCFQVLVVVVKTE
jgi:hypothetical protein